MTEAKLIRTIAAFSVFLFVATISSVAYADSRPMAPVGTIRGGVYQDLDGDGNCSETESEESKPAPGVEILFSTGSTRLTLFSGSNGTYGLIPVGAGSWQVEARPDPRLWLVTSANPLHVEVTTGRGAVQTGVNFCVLRISGPAIAALTTTTDYVSGSPSSSAAIRPVIQDPIAEKAIISEYLLTNPPAPRPPEDIAETLETPVDADATPAAEWLRYLNLFREKGKLPQLTEEELLTYGSQWHSRYMVVNDTPIAHSEERSNVLYDPSGDHAARNSNIFATPQLEADYMWAINFWISAPFHLVPIIDPALSSVGFGRHNQGVGNFTMASVLDVRTGLTETPADTAYPIYFPGDGTSTWIVRHSLFEWPDAMHSCPGYARPSGPPLVLQLGDGDRTPRVSSHAVYMNDQLLDSCLFDETSYYNPDPFAQSTGRRILDERDAIVIIPRHQLAVGQTYRVEVTVDGQFYTWQFNTQRGPDG